MTRKEKVAAGVPKGPKRKKAYATRLKDERAEVAKVTLKNYRSSARKMRLIVDQIRGMEVYDALNTLKFTQKSAAPAVARLVRAGVASYEEKFDGERVDVGTHYVKTAFVDGSRMLKRLRPAPQGRAHIIRKRYCHVTLVIDRIPTSDED
ncbi:50S ribosomal protein L22 [Pontibacter sp. G13]|uniref:50S ribosomal protein L22 n=1 Tax=Pontibacter sp. G13 TaxID=3074898 RepID=UPI00288C118E|nr:50S ribosomal protein L22 [Pontibacter sp. G13]WNJ16522.1 50S ribosomal protein L22 [Pontibacter sp. G13]